VNDAGAVTRRRGQVLLVEAHELAACMLALTALLTAPQHPCGHRMVQTGCGGCDQGAGWQLVDGRLVPAP
jgi:hypothetical protein